jgi:proteasome alpha subunit
MFHILYDGSVVDEDRFSVLGGEAEAITTRMAQAFQGGWSLTEALKAAVAALGGPDQVLAVPDLEVAVLARTESRRSFRRVEDAETAVLLGLTPEAVAEAAAAEPSSKAPGAGGELSDLPAPPEPDAGNGTGSDDSAS